MKLYSIAAIVSACTVGALNCVSSLLDSSAPNYTAPFPIYKSSKETFDLLSICMKDLPRTAQVERTATSMHWTQKSTFFQFTDDIIFIYNPNANCIDVVSKSRVGIYDFGVNRNRVESLHLLFDKIYTNKDTALNGRYFS